MSRAASKYISKEAEHSDADTDAESEHTEDEYEKGSFVVSDEEDGDEDAVAALRAKQSADDDVVLSELQKLRKKPADANPSKKRKLEGDAKPSAPAETVKKAGE
jgi:hypothetical protein